MKRKHARLGPLVVAACAAVFLPILRHGFVDWDDDILIYANPCIRGLDVYHLRWMLTSTLNSAWQPLGWLFFAVLYALAGARAWAWHLASLVLHAASTGLVFALGLELLGSAVPAVFAALLFAAHPLQVESVAWASCLADLLCCALALGSALAYVRAARTRRRLPYRVSVLLAVLAAFSRWEAAALPALLLLLDKYALGGELKWRDKLPFFAVSTASGAANAIAKASVMHYGSGPAAPATASLALLQLFAHVLVPAALRPVYFITPLSRPAGFGAGEALIFLAGFTLLLFLLRRKAPAAWAAWLAAVALVYPVLSVSRDGPVFMHDRYAYLPLAAFALASGALLARRKALRPPAALLIAAWAALSVAQGAVWRDAESLWKHVIAVDPQQSVAYYDLGNLYLARGRYYESIYYLREQARLNPAKGRPNLAHAWNDLGAEFADKGRWAQAERCFRAALAYAPEEPQVRANLDAARTRLRRK